MTGAWALAALGGTATTDPSTFDLPDPLGLGLLLLAGVVAGYVNAVAGAGSLLTLPALIFTGLEPVAANATNRVAVLCQTGAALVAIRRSGGRRPALRAAWLLLPALAGGVVGASLAGQASEDVIRGSLAIAMPVFLVLGAIKPTRPPPSAGSGPGKGGGHASVRPANALAPRPALLLTFLGFGLYAGYLQAGIGVLFLLVLGSLFDVDLMEANQLKLLTVFVLAVAALGTFAVQGVPIDPLRGGALAAATTLGGYLGGAASVRRGEGLIRLALVVTVLGSSAKLVWDLLSNR